MVLPAVQSNEGWLVSFGTFLVGCLTAAATYFRGRQHGIDAGKAEFVTAVHEAAHLVITDLRADIARVQKMRDDMARQHDECQHQLASIRQEIAQLMRGAVPPYLLGMKGASDV